MPRFFFDLPWEHDAVGADLPDVRAARRLACRYAGEVLRDGFDETYWRMDVRRDAGPVLFSLLIELLPTSFTRERAITAPAEPSPRIADEDYV